MSVAIHSSHSKGTLYALASSSPLQSHPQSVATLHRQIRNDFLLETVDRTEFERLQQSRHHEFQFQHCEALADAIPDANTERNIGVRMHWIGRFRTKEAFRSEAGRFGKVFFLAVDVQRGDVDGDVGRNRVLSYRFLSSS